MCPQADIFTQKAWVPAEQSEDCLYLNIYTPIGDVSGLPVMFWIHGGGFVLGSILDYSMTETVQNLVSRGVILVSIQYRLGPLGFWSDPEAGVEGNFGLMDQVVALQWVHDNIAAFGGDPSRVTIFGESAGGAAVSFLTLSPMTKGLFSQAILMSGSVYSSFATKLETAGFDRIYADKLGCVKPSAEEQHCTKEKDCDKKQKKFDALKCMQKKNMEELMDANVGLPLMRAWAGRVDGKFLPESIEDLMGKREPIRVMMGTCANEYAAFILSDIKIEGLPQFSYETVEDLEKDIEMSFSSYMGYRNPEAVKAAIRHRYIEEVKDQVESYQPRGTFWLNQAIKMKDFDFTVGAYKDAMHYINSGATVYMYSFDYLSDSAFANSDWKGVAHAADLGYLLGWGDQGISSDKDHLHHLYGNYSNPLDPKMTEYFSTLFSNFAKSGNPTETPVKATVWEPFDPVKTNYLSINVPQPMMKEGYHRSEITFWTKLVAKLEELQCSAGPAAQ